MNQLPAVRDTTTSKFIKARSSQQMRDMSMTELKVIPKLLSNFSIDIGIEPDQEMCLHVARFLYENYPSLTLEDMKLAFNMALVGKFGEVKPYGKISKLFIAQIINAYRSAQQKVIAALPAPEVDSEASAKRWCEQRAVLVLKHYIYEPEVVIPSAIDNVVFRVLDDNITIQEFLPDHLKLTDIKWKYFRLEEKKLKKEIEAENKERAKFRLTALPVDNKRIASLRASSRLAKVLLRYWRKSNQLISITASLVRSLNHQSSSS